MGNLPHIRILTVVLVGAILAMGCRPARQEPAEVPASDGDEPPARIVSLAPSITEILFELGVGDRVVGNTDYCDYPAEAAGKTKIGGYYDPNFEGIVALQPDVVFLLEEHDPVKKVLDDLHVRYVEVNHRGVANILGSIKVIGAVCGREKEAAELTRGLQKRIDRVDRAVAGRQRPTVLVSVGRNMGTGSLSDVYIAGQDPFYNVLVGMAGGTNVYTDTRIAFPMVSREGILRLDPDVIIDLVADLEPTAENLARVRQEWDGVGSVKAVRSGRVHIFTEDYVTVPGPRFVLILEMIAKALHPKAEFE